MATPTVALAPNPHWVIIDNFSKLPPGAVIYTFFQNNPTVYQPAFQDPLGLDPYPQPIPGKGNGTFNPIYWYTSSPYYIEVWSGLKGFDGSVMLWNFQGLMGGSGGGGDETVNNFSTVDNLVINGTFYRPNGIIGNPGTPVATTPLMILAPSNNHGYVNDAANTNGYVGPDIVFTKNSGSTSAANISYDQFQPTGVTTFSPDVTPPYYVTYTSTVGGAGETYKFIQFPISNGIVNLSGQTVTVRLWANLQSGSPNVALVFRQFYGSGSNAPAADILTNVTGVGTFLPLVAGSGWNLYEFVIVLPNTPGQVGNCGNDGTFLQIQLPLAPALSTFSFIKPAVYLGDITPPADVNLGIIDYHSNDYIDSIISTPRTGDIRFSLNSFSPYGWVVMNDGTIGSASSGATTRANIDTFPLYDLIWNTFQANQTLAPLVPPGYGLSSIADFTANKPITLTKAAGRLIAAVGLPSTNSVPITGGSNTGTTWAIGQSTGNEQHTQSVNELAQHQHLAQFNQNFIQTGSGSADIGALTSGSVPTTGNISGWAGPTPFNVQAPVTYMNVFIKL